MNLQHQSRRSHQTRICSLSAGFGSVPRRLIADRIFGRRPPGRSVFLAYQIEGFSLIIPLPLRALYFKDIGAIKKMLATQKDLCCLIQLRCCTIARNRHLACSTKSEFSCGTGILPVHKKLIENGARCEIQPTNILSRGSSGALTTVLRINLFAVLSPKVYLEVSPFLSCGGASKYQ